MRAGERAITDEILVKYLAGEASDAEQREVQQWLQGGEDNKKYFAHFKLIWNESRALDTAGAVDTDEAWARFKQRTQQPKKVVPIPVSYRWVKIAALLLLLAGGSWLAYFMASPNRPQQMAMQAKPNPVNEQPTTKSDVSTEPVTTNATNESPTKPANADITETAKESNNEPVAKVAAKKRKDKTGPVASGYTSANRIPATIVTGSSTTLASNKNLAIQTNANNRIAESALEQTGTAPAAYQWAKAEKSAYHNKAVASRSNTKFLNKNYSEGLFKYDKTQDFICNSTPCPIEICIIQTVKCPNGTPAAVSTCSVLEPDESGQLRYKAFDKITKNCNATVDEIRIKQVSTGETIVLNSDSKPATAQEFFSYITGQKKGDITAGIFHTDCNNNKDDCGLMFDNSNLILH